MSVDNRMFMFIIIEDCCINSLNKGKQVEFFNMGPVRFTNYSDDIGDTEKRLYSYSEVQKLQLAKTKDKKLRTLKKGKFLRLCKSSLGKSFGIYCVPEEYQNVLEEQDNVSNDLQYVREEIRKNVPRHLYDEEKRLLKQQKKLRKEQEKFHQ